MDVLIWLSRSHKLELKIRYGPLVSNKNIYPKEKKRECYLSHPDIDKWIKSKGFDKYPKGSPTELIFSKKIRENKLLILVYPFDNFTERFNPFINPRG